MIDVRRIRAELRKGRGEHKVVVVNAGKPYLTGVIYADGDKQVRWPVWVEVTESPGERSVYVHVNGKQVWP